MANKADVNSIPKSGSLPSAKIHPSNDPEIEPSAYILEKFTLHETRQRFYIIGSDRYKRFFRVLKIDRSEASELIISEDPVVYSQQEVKSLLQRIDEGNRSTGGLRFVTKFYGVVGCISFLESYYLILVTKRHQIGSICGHAIYSIEESQFITIPHVTVQSEVAHSKAELRYKKLFSNMDLTKDFFFSYTYPVMRSLQKNVLSDGKSGMPYDNMFVWNSYLSEGIRSRCKNNIWTIALVHGHFKQVRMSIFGHDFTVTLVSRRSRHFAGTRYLKRGLNVKGRVANDVETEQIVLHEDAGLCKGKMSSVVQMRGSIPLFWSQEASRFSPKPDIILQRYDPTYEATKKHFEDLEERYGNPIIVLNLIKTFEKRPREMMLRREFANAVGFLNQILPEEKHLKFIHWDFHKFAKTKSANVLAVLGAVADEALDLTGFYYSGKSSAGKNRSSQVSRSTIMRDSSLKNLRLRSSDLSRTRSSDTLNTLASREKDFKKEIYGGAEPCFQSGVLRTNCIDCLDRTNVAQFACGLAALGRQLQAMGLADTHKVDPDSSIAIALMDMYQGMGDSLAHQYGGSAAHNTVFPDKQGKWRATTQSRELFKSIKRYYSNAYTDGEKQDAINLFLGYYKPKERRLPLWELDSDCYLHVSGVGDELLPNQSSSGDTVAMPAIVSSTFEPIPACKEDFSRIKLTSFDKLIERTCSSIKNVRLCSESDHHTLGVAPDAAEIQLKSPNWLFGQRKHQENVNALKIASCPCGGSQEEREHTSLDLTWLSTNDYIIEEDMLERYLAVTSENEATNGWYGGSLLGDQDENSEIYKHYDELCKGPPMEPFENNFEKEQYYANFLRTESIEEYMDDAAIEAEMEAFLKEYDQIGDHLGIVPTCKSFAGDASQVTRWLIGEESFLQS